MPSTKINQTVDLSQWNPASVRRLFGMPGAYGCLSENSGITLKGALWVLPRLSTRQYEITLLWCGVSHSPGEFHVLTPAEIANRCGITRARENQVRNTVAKLLNDASRNLDSRIAEEEELNVEVLELNVEVLESNPVQSHKSVTPFPAGLSVPTVMLLESKRIPATEHLSKLNLSVRAFNCLTSSGLCNIEDVLLWTAEELMQIPNIGLLTMQQIINEIFLHGHVLPKMPLPVATTEVNQEKIASIQDRLVMRDEEQRLRTYFFAIVNSYINKHGWRLLEVEKNFGTSRAIAHSLVVGNIKGVSLASVLRAVLLLGYDIDVQIKQNSESHGRIQFEHQEEDALPEYISRRVDALLSPTRNLPLSPDQKRLWLETTEKIV